MKTPLVLARALFAGLFVFITYLTLSPNPEDPTGFAAARFLASVIFGNEQAADKIAHFFGYGALGAAAFWARVFLFNKKRWTPLLLAFYGALLEGVQGLGGVRTPELADAIANALGAIAGFTGAYVLSLMIMRILKR